MTKSDLQAYRNSPAEQQRVGDLIRLVPPRLSSALDVGARDGYLSIRLADTGLQVTALDLEIPRIADSRVRCIQGDVMQLPFADRTFDLVLCAEVLEHLPPHLLQRACTELARVAGRWLIVGVPYRQDLRIGRTTCGHCEKINPPWGHVNSFDEAKLSGLFPHARIHKQTYVGETNDATNALATALLDFAGNPFGTYGQDESCVHCGRPLVSPTRRPLAKRLATRAGTLIQRRLSRARPPCAKWIHILVEK